MFLIQELLDNLKFMSYKKIIATQILLLPLVSSAQLEETSKFFEKIKSIFDTTLIPLAFFIALASFFWGVAKYIRAESSGTAKAEARNFLVWGVVALFVISTLWGIVKLIQKEFGINDNPESMKIPTLK